MTTVGYVLPSPAVVDLTSARLTIQVSVPGRIEYYRNDQREPFQNCIENCRLCLRGIRGPAPLPGRRRVLVSDEIESDDIWQDERRQFDRMRLIVDGHFEAVAAMVVASTKDIRP